MANNNIWHKLWKPTTIKWLLGIPLGAFLTFILGAVSILGVDKVFQVSNQNELCYGCHIGMDTIVEEYEQSVHFNNRAGIQADCADCHVPKEFIPKLSTKVIALGDVYHMLMETYTLENWEENRNMLAQSAYEKIKALDSSTCKSCHDPEQWSGIIQPSRARLNHDPQLWVDKNKTCVDCHKGVAHKRPVVKN